MHFLAQALSQDVTHIDNISLLRNTQIVLSIVFMCNLSTFLFHIDNIYFFFLLVFFGGF
jgi:hypothetical protein